MRYRTISSALMVFALFSGAASAARAQALDSTARQRLIDEGIALHDRGDFDGAIAKYREILAENPQDTEALYEIGFAQFAKGDYPGCITTAVRALKTASTLRVGLLTLGGNCHDLAGDGKKAIEWHERGLAESPHDPGLLFNLGVVYLGSGDSEKALDLLERTVSEAPAHRSANLALGQLYQQDGRRVDAVLAYLRFLSLDHESARARGAAEAVRGLLLQGVSVDDGGNVTISVDPSRDGDALSTLDLALSLAAASQDIEEEEPKPEAIRLAATLSAMVQMATTVQMASEMRPGNAAACFSCRQYLPFFVEMREAGHLEAFGYLALSPLELEGAADWLSANGAKVEALNRWLAAKAGQK